MIKSKTLKKIKKDYQAKNLRNPFFHKVKKGSGKKHWPLFLFFLFILFIILFWFFGFSSFWNLKNIEVSGLTRSSDTDLKNIIYNQSNSRRYLIFKEKNILFFNTTKAHDDILNQYNFTNVNVSVKWPHTIIVKVYERPYAFIFREGNNCNYCSADSFLIKEVPVTADDLKKYFVLENDTPVSVTKNGKIDVPEDYLNFILTLSKAISNYPELSVEKFEIDQSFRSVNVKFNNGPTVYFNTKLDATEQLNRLILVKKEKIKDNFSKVNYIDLRYGDRLFIN
jgi:cell division septal protein FtsQ